MRRNFEQIQKLQLKILELEKKQKDENYKKISIDYNFKVINNLLNEKKTTINNYKYCKSVPLAKYYDHLEAIYNILQIIDERLIKLEEK